MLNDLIDSLGRFFAHTAVSNYLFPIVSGTYLAFVTASIIRFAQLRRDAVRALDNAYAYLLQADLQIGPMPWLNHLNRAFAEARSAGVELREAGHLRGATAYLEIVESLANRGASSIVSAKTAAFANWYESLSSDQPDYLKNLARINGGVAYKNAAIAAVFEGLGESKKKTNRLKGSALTFVQLKVISDWLDNNETLWLRRRKHQECCRHCGKRLFDEV